MSGWYKQQRSITERPWFKDALMVQLYTYLKSMAYVADSKFEGRIIRRGSCPTTRSEMSEMTGMSVRTLDRVLRRLVAYGEIIVKGNSRFSVITICDYDSCVVPESLFGAADGITDGITDGIAGGTTYTNIKEGRIEDSLITPYSPYKTEREMKDLALEVKKMYNKMFDGQLPPLIRLHLPVRNMVMECVRRFGRQSIDIVFEQVQHERFSMGDNRTGFIASFQFIFEPANYQKYLERAQLRRQKASQPQQEKQDPVGAIDAHEVKTESKPERRAQLEGMVALVEKNPKSWCRTTLVAAYNTGELAQLGIDWRP